MLTGIPLYLPVIVRNPRSEERTKGVGRASRWVEMVRAREGEPTVMMRLATSPLRIPRW